jgi:hypothetical protein
VNDASIAVASPFLDHGKPGVSIQAVCRPRPRTLSARPSRALKPPVIMTCDGKQVMPPSDGEIARDFPPQFELAARIRTKRGSTRLGTDRVRANPREQGRRKGLGCRYPHLEERRSLRHLLIDPHERARVRRRLGLYDGARTLATINWTAASFSYAVRTVPRDTKLGSENLP